MSELPKSLTGHPLSGAEQDVLWCLFLHGPTWDGNIPSKAGRCDLVERGYVSRFNGWNYLTEDGVTLAIEIGLGDKKDADDARRRFRP